MSRPLQVAVTLLVAAAALAAGFWLRGSRLQPDPPPGISAEPLLAASFPDLEGRPQALAQWKGRVLVVNFWATWCAPCKEEIPEFVALQDKYGRRGLTFVGIALDAREAVAPFVQELAINYPVLTGNLSAMDLAAKMGGPAGAVPVTVVLDRKGRVMKMHAGRLHRGDLEPLILKLL